MAGWPYKVCIKFDQDGRSIRETGMWHSVVSSRGRRITGSVKHTVTMMAGSWWEGTSREIKEVTVNKAGGERSCMRNVSSESQVLTALGQSLWLDTQPQAVLFPWCLEYGVPRMDPGSHSDVLA